MQATVSTKGQSRGSRTRSSRRRTLVGIALPVLILIIWQVLYNIGWIDRLFMSSPLGVLETLIDMTISGSIFPHMGISLQRAGLGFLIGGGLGLLFGIWTGFSRNSQQMLDPMLQILRLTPNLALAPLFILWFGFGETSKIALIANIAFFPLYLNTYLGIRNIDNKWMEVARVLQFSRWQRLRQLIFPASLPPILLGMRLSLAGSWLGLVVAELIGSQAGIGHLITFGQANNRTDIIFTGIIIFAVMGKAVDSFVRLLERRLLVWQDSYRG